MKLKALLLLLLIAATMAVGYFIVDDMPALIEEPSIWSQVVFANLEEEVDGGPEGPTDPPPFETGRDGGGEGDETEEEPFQPLIAPAPRGNPVQPQFIQTISPTIHVKMGTY